MEEANQTNDQAQAEIALELAKSWCGDFPSSCIPDDDEGLHALFAECQRVEQDLTGMMEDRTADGTPLSPDRDFEDLYEVLNDRYNRINRAMYTSFANSLQQCELPGKDGTGRSLIRLYRQSMKSTRARTAIFVTEVHRR